ncbi:GNAT family N-acetyltransferase [Chitinophaga sp. MD30]|uniref:GNAT family N-acetyltransferase n=1 Tax=Chitinophaga sp. MD30 TaxID=2033437 RepID=UPI0012FD53C2|nr:GNAT family N-acetyltransferase [Chitinophaga sp. MD30]
MFVLRELTTLEEMKANYWLLQLLNAPLQEADYETMLADMIPKGYGQVAVYEGERCVGISGFWIGTKIYCGKYIEMDNVVVDPTYRSGGIGKLLCRWIEEKAVATNCKTVMLDAYVQNRDAHRFYFRRDLSFWDSICRRCCKYGIQEVLK